MKFPKTFLLKEIAQIISSDFVGDENFPVHGMNEIHVVTPGDIVFVDHPKYYDKALQSAATVVLINKEVDCPDGKALLISDDPFRDFNKLTQHFKPFQASNAAISDSANIGEGTIIQPNCFIGENVVLKNSTIGPYVSIGEDSLVTDSKISNSLIQTNVKISNATLDNAMIGNHATYNGNFTSVSIGDYSELT